MKCPVCGATNEAGAAFCYQCGNALQAPDGSARPATGRTVALSPDDQNATGDAERAPVQDDPTTDTLGGYAREASRPPAAFPQPSPGAARVYSVPAENLPRSYPGARWTTVAPSSNLAVFALIFGILSYIFLWFIGGIGAVILGHMARSEIRASGGRLGGEGMATAGLVLGYVNIAISLIIFLVFCLPLLLVFGR